MSIQIVHVSKPSYYVFSEPMSKVGQKLMYIMEPEFITTSNARAQSAEA